MGNSTGLVFAYVLNVKVLGANERSQLRVKGCDGGKYGGEEGTKTCRELDDSQGRPRLVKWVPGNFKNVLEFVLKESKVEII